MRSIGRIGNALGCAALAVSFLLASPGVEVVRADTVAEQAAPEQCNAAARRQSHDARTDAFIEQLRLKHGSKTVPQLAAAAEGVQRFQVLNNRGYNYGPSPGVAVDTVMADVEARR